MLADGDFLALQLSGAVYAGVHCESRRLHVVGNSSEAEIRDNHLASAVVMISQLQIAMENSLLCAAASADGRIYSSNLDTVPGEGGQFGGAAKPGCFPSNSTR